MARKRPIEHPPPASSSEEEDEDEDEEEEAMEVESSEEKDAAEADGEDQNGASEGEDEDEELLKSPRKSNLYGSDSDIESDSEKFPPSPNISDFTIKPIEPNPAPDLAPATADESSVKKKKRKVGKAPVPSSAPNGIDETPTTQQVAASNGADEKTPGIQRLWSEEDEISLLKGMIQYKSKKGAEPSADLGDFHDFIKKSLHVDVSRDQLRSKIRKMKIKYQNNVAKGENGHDPTLSKAHDRKAFELSKKIWGPESNGEIMIVRSNKKAKTARSEEQVKDKVGGGIVVEKDSPIKEKEKDHVNGGVILGLVSSRKEKEQHKVNGGITLEPSRSRKEEMNVAAVSGGEEKGEFLKGYSCIRDILETGKSLALPEFWMGYLRERAGEIGKEKASEMEAKWNKLQREELELLLKKVELIKEQAEVALDLFKRSNF